jgi:hypothetical protein
MSISREWQSSELETSNDGKTGWRDIGSDGVMLQYVRVKPAIWDHWLRHDALPDGNIPFRGIRE